MKVEPYLFFNGRCEEAIEYYRRAVGAEVVALMRYKDMPQPAPAGSIPAGAENKVMHANLRIGDTTVMASDGHCTGEIAFKGFSLSISAANDAEAKRVFGALSDGGQVQVPLAKT